LNAYLDGELAPGAAETLAGHLRSCPACRQALERLQQLDGLLSHLPVPGVPEGFAERVLVRARRQVADRRPVPRTSRNPFRGWAAGSVLGRAAAAAVLVLGLTAGTYLGEQAGRRASGQDLARITSAGDPVALYNLDHLSGTPGGSLTQAYLTLVSAPRGAGE
jgi:anti-sigma factor RsiW